MTRLEKLLEERIHRHMRERRLERVEVTGEDLVRCRQNWRRPFYNVGSSENGWPPKWMRR